MIQDQSSQRYTSVVRHGGKWLAKFRYQGKDLCLGHYGDAETAAHVADTARYLIYGTDPANWPPKVAQPNFPPRHCDEPMRSSIVATILRSGAMTDEQLAERLRQFDEVAPKPASKLAPAPAQRPARRPVPWQIQRKWDLEWRGVMRNPGWSRSPEIFC